MPPVEAEALGEVTCSERSAVPSRLVEEADHPAAWPQRDEHAVARPGEAGERVGLASDQAFAAAGVTREVAFEVTAGDFMARLIRQSLGVALLPARYTPHLAGIVTIPVTDAPTRVEYLVWDRSGPTPAVAAFLAQLDVPTHGVGVG
jgi:DNA-binding transcriptional LysR family regulator